MLLEGTVTRVNWMNPHVWIYLDVTGPNGVVTNWDCEGSAPGGLIANGWTRWTLKPGDRVALEGSRARDRPAGFKIRAARLSGGRRLVMGGTDEGIPMPAGKAAN